MESSKEQEMEVDEETKRKKEEQRSNYLQYLHRGGPSHPGSKAIPEASSHFHAFLPLSLRHLFLSLELSGGVSHNRLDAIYCHFLPPGAIKSGKYSLSFNLSEVGGNGSSMSVESRCP